jgi:hypothetical protein
MAKLTFTGPTREADAEAARAAAVLAGDAAHVHVIPAEKTHPRLYRADVVSFDPRPTVSKWQFVQACADAGITEAQLDAAVALLTPKRQRFWEYSQILDRDNPFSSRAAHQPRRPFQRPPQWNAIFLAAAALDPAYRLRNHHGHHPLLHRSRSHRRCCRRRRRSILQRALVLDLAAMGGAHWIRTATTHRKSTRSRASLRRNSRRKKGRASLPPRSPMPNRRQACPSP